MNEEAANRKRRRNEDDESGRPSEPSATGLTTTTPSADDGEESERWSQDVHRSFIEAIYEAGVSQSSPSVILENMTQRPHSLTSERVKSHLQKYRKNKKKSQEEFLQDYDSFMRKALTVGGGGGGASVVMPPAAMIEMMGGGTPSGGDIAAFLSYSVMTEGENKNASGNPMISPVGLARESQDYLQNFAGTCVPFPQLTEEEKRSPLGISMVYVMGLFSSLSQHMMNERRSRAQSRPLSNEVPPACMPPPESSSPFPQSQQSATNPSLGSNNIANGKYAPSAAYATQPTNNNNIPGAQTNTQWNNNIAPQFIQYASSNGGNQLLSAGANRPTTSGAFLPIIPRPDASVPTRNNVMPGTDWNSLRQPSGRVQMATQNPGTPSKPESFAQV